MLCLLLRRISCSKACYRHPTTLLPWHSITVVLGASFFKSNLISSRAMPGRKRENAKFLTPSKSTVWKKLSRQMRIGVMRKSASLPNSSIFRPQRSTSGTGIASASKRTHLTAVVHFQSCTTELTRQTTIKRQH